MAKKFTPTNLEGDQLDPYVQDTIALCRLNTDGILTSSGSLNTNVVTVIRHGLASPDQESGVYIVASLVEVSAALERIYAEEIAKRKTDSE